MLTVTEEMGQGSNRGVRAGQ